MFLLGKNVFVKRFAWWAPVGTGEDDEHRLLALGSLGLSGSEVGFEFTGGSDSDSGSGDHRDGEFLYHGHCGH